MNLKTYDSTIRFDNLDVLEKLAKQLTPPIWPKEFGNINDEKAAAGAKHFEKYCAKCHAGPKADGSIIIPLNVIQTDERRIKNVRKPVGNVAFFDAQSPILKRVIRQAGLQSDGAENLWRPSKELDPKLAEGYANRPLPAVWASASSSPQRLGPEPLSAKLLPAGEPRQDISRGPLREYDPKHLGYTLGPVRTLFLYDTGKTGNANSGHSGPQYGTDQLNEENRWELIEYLKTR